MCFQYCLIMQYGYWCHTNHVGREGIETKRIRRLFDKNSYGYYIKNIVCRKFGIEEYFFLTRLLQAYLIQF
jgi:hypothetical protein